MLSFLSLDHIFIGGQFENQEVNLTNGDCNGKCLGIKSLRYHFSLVSLFGHIPIVLKIEFDTGEDCHKTKRLFNKPERQITDKLCKTRIVGNQIDLLLFKLTTMLKVVNIIYLGIVYYLQLNILICVSSFYVYKRIKVTSLLLQQRRSDKALLC